MACSALFPPSPTPIVILSLQQPAPQLQRAPPKLEEVRDFHVEKAINSSMPWGGTESGRQGGREGRRMSVDISKKWEL